MDEVHQRPPLPIAARRKNMKDRKAQISPPYEFRHVGHIGVDDTSKGNKKTVISNFQIPSAEDLPQAPTYERVIMKPAKETPILGRQTPPIARTNELHPSSTSDYLKKKLDTSDITMDKVDVRCQKNISPPIHYENVPTTHSYENITRNKDHPQPQPSIKKNPPPPPPSIMKPKLKSEEELKFKAEPKENIVYRNLPTLTKIPEESVCITINTPERIEQPNITLIVERPTLLGEMKIRLDDPIPLQEELSSKNHTEISPSKSYQTVDVFRICNYNNHLQKTQSSGIEGEAKEMASNSPKNAPPRPPAPLRKTLISSESKLNLIQKSNGVKDKWHQNSNSIATETINDQHADSETVEEYEEFKKSNGYKTMSQLNYSDESGPLEESISKYCKVNMLENKSETKMLKTDDNTSSKDIVESLVDHDQNQPPVPKPRTKLSLPYFEGKTNEITCTGTPLIVMDENLVGKLTDDCNQLRVISEAICTMSYDEDVRTINGEPPRTQTDEEQIISRF